MYNLLSIYACLSQVVLVVKNLSAMLETSEVQVQSLGQEDPLEEELVPTPVLFLGKSHGQRSLVGCSPWGHKELDTTELLSRHTHTCIQYMHFLCKRHPIPLDRWSTRQHFSSASGGHSECKLTNQKHGNEKNMALNKTRKRPASTE